MMNWKKIAACAAAAMTLVCSASAMSASAAEKYAYKKGDINGDGIIGAADLVRITAYVKSIKGVSDSRSLGAADVNFDGKINTSDLIKIAAYVKGIKSFADGDVNGDGKITKADVDAVADHVKGIKALKGSALKNADVKPDNSINVTDVTRLAAYYNEFAK